jgi:SNF2 family DNA or RNA helicase
MKILKDKKAVLLKLRDPSRVTTVIDKAVMVNDGGHQCVAIPHKPDETRILRNLGFNVPDPMEYYYEFPARFKPYEAQIKSASFLSMNNRAFCLNGMGLGKTITSLWAYDYMRHTKQVNSCLIVCPLSTMERTWADEVFKTFPHLEFRVLYGDRKKRLTLLNQKADVYIINTDGIKIVGAELAKRKDIDLIIIDEVAMFRNQSTDRWKSMNAICNKQSPRRVWGLTGAPIPNEPLDAWAQVKLVNPTSTTLPKYFNDFKMATMVQLNQFKWVAKKDALQTVLEVMQPSIRFALDDCVDLPPEIVIDRDAEMTDEQNKLYKSMLVKLKAEAEAGSIMAINEAVKLQKLVQIACGVAYGKDEDDIDIDCSKRIEVLHELIESAEGKVIVFVPLTGVLHKLHTELQTRYSVAVVHGGVSKVERDTIFAQFQKQTDPKILLANPQTMAHGLTLTAATMTVWYAPINSNDIYEQACARVRRPSQTKTTVIAHIAACDVERKMYQRLRQKQKTQGTLLDMFKDALLADCT